jgi:hypothetical protein
MSYPRAITGQRLYTASVQVRGSFLGFGSRRDPIPVAENLSGAYDPPGVACRPGSPHPGWRAPDRPVRDQFAHKSIGQVADHFAMITGSLDQQPAVIGHSCGVGGTQNPANRQRAVPLTWTSSATPSPTRSVRTRRSSYTRPSPCQPPACRCSRPQPPTSPRGPRSSRCPAVGTRSPSTTAGGRADTALAFVQRLTPEHPAGAGSASS